MFLCCFSLPPFFFVLHLLSIFFFVCGDVGVFVLLLFSACLQRLVAAEKLAYLYRFDESVRKRGCAGCLVVEITV